MYPFSFENSTFSLRIRLPSTRIRWKRIENDMKTLRVDASFFENGEKKLRFQTKTDTCGQGLNRNSTKTIQIILNKTIFSLHMYWCSGFPS